MARRRLRQLYSSSNSYHHHHHRSLATVDTTSLTVIEAAPGTRHFVLAAGLLQMTGVFFIGSSQSEYSGGVELQGGECIYKYIRKEVSEEMMNE